MHGEIIPLPPNASRLADEYLVLIFENLTTEDLYATCLASKRFYGCAIRLLYRHIRYSGDMALYKTLNRFWLSAPDSMKSATLSATMRGLFRDEYTTGNPWVFWPAPDAGNWGGPARWDSRIYMVKDDSPLNGCSRLFTHLLSLTSLTTLSFESCALPDTESLSLILQGMAKLRHLSIRGCTFTVTPLPFSEGYGISTTLSLVSLTLVGNVYSRQQDDSSATPPNLSPFYYCLSPSLHSLELTWDDAALHTYVLESSFGAHPLGLSEQLETLIVHVDHIRLDMDSSQLIRFLYHDCRNVRWATILNWHGDFPADLRGAEILPRLESYTGSGFLSTRLVRDTCKEVHLVGPEQAIVSTTSILSNLNPNLSVLSFVVTHWDMEILYAVTQLFRELEILKIHCRQGQPSADTFLVMPWRFFNSYPKLRVLHIYEIGVTLASREVRRLYGPASRERIPSSSGSSSSKSIPSPQTMRALWSKACPSLKEVKWLGEETMVKADEDQWVVEKEPPDERPVPMKVVPRRPTAFEQQLFIEIEVLSDEEEAWGMDEQGFDYDDF